ncbi:hypothetical protein HanIR_Chr06g0279481 [Helianthus annuus]|nr:hypothetical protein HanIR_Chr06g0279481 [Helianthus annuus]
MLTLIAACASSRGVVAGPLYRESVWMQTLGKVACWHDERTRSDDGLMVVEEARVMMVRMEMVRKMQAAMRDLKVKLSLQSVRL